MKRTISLKFGDVNKLLIFDCVNNEHYSLYIKLILGYLYYTELISTAAVLFPRINTLNHHVTLLEKYYFPFYFIDEEMETQRG